MPHRYDIWLSAIVRRAKMDKDMIEAAIAQLSDAQLTQRPAPGVNSIATIMRHITGNLNSRFTDFLTTDGEKPDRNREGEFADYTGSREQLLRDWDRAFTTFFQAINPLTTEDVANTTIHIRGEAHTVPDALVRASTHLSYHLGQVLLIARQIKGADWKYLTVAPGASTAYIEQPPK